MPGSNSLLNDDFVNLVQRSKAQQLNALKSLASEILKRIESIENIENNICHLVNEDGLHLDEILERFEKDLICIALIRTGGVQIKAARLLGVKLTTLNTKIKRFKIEVDKF
jgi:transcriptional regulator with GAF, ATPase, and Fis domain